MAIDFHILLALLVILSFFYCECLSAQLFVDVGEGSEESDCTEDNPCKDLQRAVDTASSGDEIIFTGATNSITLTQTLEITKSLSFKPEDQSNTFTLSSGTT